MSRRLIAISRSSFGRVATNPVVARRDRSEESATNRAACGEPQNAGRDGPTAGRQRRRTERRLTLSVGFRTLMVGLESELGSVGTAGRSGMPVEFLTDGLRRIGASRGGRRGWSWSGSSSSMTLICGLSLVGVASADTARAPRDRPAMTLPAATPLTSTRSDLANRAPGALA